MIQRIQTLYLMLMSVISGIVYGMFPYGWNKSDQALYVYENLALLSGGAVIIILACITIFLFKNRKLQFVLGRINILLNFILLGVFVYWSLTVSGETTISEKGIAMFIPIVSIVLLVMANKAIKKDEDLVKSVDRLR